MDAKIKQLEMIQGIINRLANNSFLIKGWCVTLVAALFALSAKDSAQRYMIVAYIPVVIFWILDGYYLWQERLFRALYDYVRGKDDEEIDFSMDTKAFIRGKDTWSRSIISTTLLIFYITLIVMMLIVKYSL